MVQWTDDTDDAVPLEKRSRRQDQVIGFLTDDKAAFLKRLQEKGPVIAYRFGRHLDEDYVAFAEGRQWSRAEWEEYQRSPEPRTAPRGKPWLKADWEAWLKPDLLAPVPADLTDEQRTAFLRKQDLLRNFFGGTNLGEPLYTAMSLQAGQRVEGIIVFSDGRSNGEHAATLQAVAGRAAKTGTPLFTVAVGEDRPRVRIKIADIRLPAHARPEDRFPVIMLIEGEGLAGQEFGVTLHVTRVLRSGDGKEQVVPIELIETKANDEPTGKVLTLPKEGVDLKPGKAPRFSADAVPYAAVPFLLDAATLPRVAGLKLPAEGTKLQLREDFLDKANGKESELRIVARVPRAKGEVFTAREHLSEPEALQIIKRPLRVLLLAGGANRDYQFTRTLFVREMEKGRVELCVHLQPPPGQAKPRPGLSADLPPERMLAEFPSRLADPAETSEARYDNLASYDLVMAFDPDWSLISDKALENVERWVQQGGGLIHFAGPVNTLQLPRPGAQRDKLKPIVNLLPVVLKDSRVEADRRTDEPFPLAFHGARLEELGFLKLDGDADTAILAGWEQFFGKVARSEKTAKEVAERGFYTYYPVSELKEGALIIATFTDPDARLIDGRQQPYLVSAARGRGKAVWVGSCELWRLRQYKEAYHERFLTGLARYAGAGNLSQSNSHVTLVIGRTFAAGSQVQVEAQILGKDRKPLDRKARPEVTLRLPPGVSEKEVPTGFELTAKPGSDDGWFAGRFPVRSPGIYRLELKVKETGDVYTHRFTVIEPDPELDNVRPDFDQLYGLASEATGVLKHLDETTQTELRLRLRKPPAKDREARLLFDLKGAALIPDCVLLPKAPPARPLSSVEEVKSARLRLRELRPAVRLAALGLPADFSVLVDNPGDVESKPIFLRVKVNDDERFDASELLPPIPPKSHRKVTFRTALVQRGVNRITVALEPEADGVVLAATVEVRDRVPVLLIDGDPGAGGKASEDLRFVAAALDAARAYQVVSGHAAELEKRDLESYAAVWLLNVAELSDTARARLEEFARAGGGVAFFLGDRVKPDWYNKHLYAGGRGLFPVALADRPSPELTEEQKEERRRQTLRGDKPQLTLPGSAHPVVTALATEAGARRLLFLLTIDRHFPVDRTHWQGMRGRGEVLVSLAAGDPLLLAGRHGKGRTLAFLSTAAAKWNDWARFPTFPILINEMQRYLTGEPLPQPGKRSQAELEALWTDLASKESLAAERAWLDLAVAPEQAVLHVSEELRKALTAEKALRLPTEAEWTREQLRAVRALDLLQELNTPAARKALEALARVTPENWLTREAGEALERMAK
jgi:hypothetical protein